jgi:hypothetical protein
LPVVLQMAAPAQVAEGQLRHDDEPVDGAYEPGYYWNNNTHLWT